MKSCHLNRNRFTPIGQNRKVVLCLNDWYDSRVVIYEHKMFIRLATGLQQGNLSRISTVWYGWMQHDDRRVKEDQCDRSWRNFANFKYQSQFWKALFSIWQHFEPPLATFYAIGNICTVANGQVLKCNLAIWSHWRRRKQKNTTKTIIIDIDWLLNKQPQIVLAANASVEAFLVSEQKQ